MFNIMLDALPTEYEGYALNTDYRVGIQLTQASADSELNSYEKIQVFALLLFKEPIKDTEIICKAVDWFLDGWCFDNLISQGKSGKQMDYDVDAGRIYSAFYSQYKIDLNTAKMHYWKFMYLLSNLEECAFTRVIEVRAKQITNKMSKEEKPGGTKTSLEAEYFWISPAMVVSSHVGLWVRMQRVL